MGLTDAQGRFFFPRIPAGNYTVEVGYLGREAQSQEVAIRGVNVAWEHERCQPERGHCTTARAKRQPGGRWRGSDCEHIFRGKRSIHPVNRWRRMSSERRYTDDEVADIIRRAAAQPAADHRLPMPDGLTLTELQAIGREVGIGPGQIATAAMEVDGRGTPLPARRRLGMPVTAGLSVPLPRAPSDSEWERLLGDIRQTFGAHGKTDASGSARVWRNGNLRVYCEPGDGGYRLRFSTRKSDAASFNLLGVGALLLGLLMMTFVLLGTGGELLGALLITVMGVLALGRNVLMLPRWASEREEQFEALGARAQAFLAEPARTDDAPTVPAH